MNYDLTKELHVKYGAKEWDVRNLSALPQASAIYFLCSQMRIKYIGITGMLRERISAHRRNKKFARFFYFETGTRRGNIERALIGHYRPPLNIICAESLDLTIREKIVLKLRGKLPKTKLTQ